MSDITYICTRSGWLSLATVLDLHSRKTVGWAMAPQMPATLVWAALQMAIAQRNPKPGLVVHSDRGSQYASSQHQALLAKHGLLLRPSEVISDFNTCPMVKDQFLQTSAGRIYSGQHEPQRQLLGGLGVMP